MPANGPTTDKIIKHAEAAVREHHRNCPGVRSAEKAERSASHAMDPRSKTMADKPHCKTLTVRAIRHLQQCLMAPKWADTPRKVVVAGTLLEDPAFEGIDMPTSMLIAREDSAEEIEAKRGAQKQWDAAERELHMSDSERDIARTAVKNIIEQKAMPIDKDAVALIVALGLDEE